MAPACLQRGWAPLSPDAVRQIAGGITLVVSPLVALMDDQLAELARLDVPAERVTAETSAEDAKQLRQRVLNPTTTRMVRCASAVDRARRSHRVS